MHARTDRWMEKGSGKRDLEVVDVEGWDVEGWFKALQQFPLPRLASPRSFLRASLLSPCIPPLPLPPSFPRASLLSPCLPPFCLPRPLARSLCTSGLLSVSLTPFITLAPLPLSLSLCLPPLSLALPSSTRALPDLNHDRSGASRDADNRSVSSIASVWLVNHCQYDFDSDTIERKRSRTNATTN